MLKKLSQFKIDNSNDISCEEYKKVTIPYTSPVLTNDNVWEFEYCADCRYFEDAKQCAISGEEVYYCSSACIHFKQLNLL